MATLPAAFSQTTRALEGDRPRVTLVTLALALPLLAAWAQWFSSAEITVHELTDAARVEVAQASHDVDAPTSGRVIATRLVLGLEVGEGDVLVELDAETEKRKLAEEKTRLASIEPELEARRRQLAAVEQSLASDRETTVTALAQARANKDAAEIAARQATEEARRAQQLHESGAISELETMRAKTDAARARATLDGVALEVARLDGAQRTRDVQGRSRAEELRSEMASLDGQKQRARAAIEVLEQEVANRTLRAGVAGKVGEAAKVGIGQFVKAGERLGAIIPAGGLRAVAELSPEAALGRVRAGQAARMRMQSFPWVQYGVVPAMVTNVGSELRNGKVRVELRIEPSAGSRILLSHGMPGTIEIDVDRATPAQLVFQAAGRALGRPVQSQAATE